MKHAWILQDKNDLNNVILCTDNELIKKSTEGSSLCNTVAEALKELSKSYYISDEYIEREKGNDN